jgi:hypothetical protein
MVKLLVYKALNVDRSEILSMSVYSLRISCYQHFMRDVLKYNVMIKNSLLIILMA